LVTHTNLKTMKTFNQVLDFLELQQQEDKLNTNQLHLIIQTLTTFLDNEQMQEVENLFNHFKK
jgi:archaellum biogenesis ATPase FlaH